ncbi:MAG: hypothetical protein KAT68_17340 [Bacteroidales bacterium]|nr:hypothetical protein [Bacteroidales bacterium]
MKYLFILVLLFALCLSAKEVTIKADLTETFEVSPDSTLLYLFQTYTIRQFTFTDTIIITKQDINNQIDNIENELKQIKVKESEINDEHYENLGIIKNAVIPRENKRAFWEKQLDKLKK